MKRLASRALAVYLLAAGIYGLVQLVRGATPELSWLGLTLAALAPLARLGIELTSRELPPRPSLGYTVLSGLGMAITLTMSWRYGPAAGWVHLWAGAAFVGWVVYLRLLRPAESAEAPPT